MTGRRWTRPELMELARDRFVAARNLQALDVEAPAWLVEGSSRGRWTFNSGESLEMTHPADRDALVTAFLKSADNPGELVPVRVRSRRTGAWRYSQSVWLNMVDDEDIGMILVFVGEAEADPDEEPIEAPVEETIGHHASTLWMLWTLSGTGYTTAVEGACVELLGYESHELVGRHPTELIPPDTIADSIAMWADLHERPGNTATNRRVWVRRDGSRIWMEDACFNRTDSNGETSVLMVSWDATDQMAQEQALRERQEELVAREAEKSALAAQMHELAAQMQALAGDFKLLADEVPAAVFRCDASGVVLFHNARWSELVAGDDVRLHDLVAPDDHARLDEVLAELVQADAGERRRSVELTGDAEARIWRLNLRATGEREHGSLVGSIEDVSATVRLRREARQDALTGLWNRAALHEHVANALRADPTGVLVYFVDLDGFKDVNDTWGHDAGDTVLTEIARRIRVGVRPDDVVARYGGDEFVVLCADASTTTPAEIADRLTCALTGDIPFDGGSWRASASIGWARGEAGDDITSLVRRADLDMFEHKRGRASRASR